MSNPQKPFSESGSSPPITKATVTSVQIMLGSTISTGRARAADGRSIIFMGDWRAMLQIAEALKADEDDAVVCAIGGEPVAFECEGFRVGRVEIVAAPGRARRSRAWARVADVPLVAAA